MDSMQKPEVKKKRRSLRNQGLPVSPLVESICRPKEGRSKWEGNVLHLILASQCSGSTMSDNGFFLLTAYLHLCGLPNATGIMERPCLCALSPRVVELWCNNQQPHLKACHQIEPSTLHHYIQIAGGGMPEREEIQKAQLWLVPRGGTQCRSLVVEDLRLSVSMRKQKSHF